MKRTFTLFLALALCLCLCACKSEEAKNAESLISAIGTVTLDSESAITAAEEAYAALSEEDKANVENYALLTDARSTYEEAVAQAQIAAAQELIDAIGEVTLDSEAALTAAEEAYAALADAHKPQVTNAAKLADARVAYDEAVAAAKQEALLQSLTGTWLHEIMGYGAYDAIMSEVDCAPVSVSFETDNGSYSGDAATFTLAEDGSFQIEGLTIGTWSISDDCSQITAEITADGLDAQTITMTVQEEDGFVKLFGEFLGNKACAYVLDTQFKDAFDAKYAVVELTVENFRDYIGEPVDMGSAKTLDGTTQYWYFFPSEAYDDGLVYLGCDVAVDVEFRYGGNQKIVCTYPVVMGFSVDISNLQLGDGASGEMFYIKADHVASNYLNEEGYRVLELTNGMVLRFADSVVWDSYEAFWTLADASYDDYLY